MLQLESGSTTSFSVENSLLKRLQSCRKRDNKINELKQSNQSTAFFIQHLLAIATQFEDSSRGIDLFQAESATQEDLGGSEALFWVVKAVGD